MQDDPVLQRFSLSQDDLLGFGGESRVYALNDETVLRVYIGHHQFAKLR